VFAGIAGAKQPPQFLFGFRKGAVESFLITVLAYAIAQAKDIFATLVNAAVSVCAFSHAFCPLAFLT
jgi:hypothetical protein